MAHSKKKAAEDFLIAVFSTRILKDIKECATDDIILKTKKGIYGKSKADLESFILAFYDRYPITALFQDDSPKKSLREDGKFRMKYHLECETNSGKTIDHSGWIVLDFFEPRENRYFITEFEFYSDNELDLPEPVSKLTIEDLMKEIISKEVEHKERMVRPKYLSSFHGKFLKGNIPV